MERTGGFSWRPGSGAPTTGYALSIYPEHERIIDGDADADAINAYKRELKEFVKSTPNAHFGGWYDPEVKKTYLDVSVILDDQAAARELAVKHKQAAFYDLAQGDTVYVNARDDGEAKAAADLLRLWRGGDGRGSRSARGFPDLPGELEAKHGGGSHDDLSHGNWSNARPPVGGSSGGAAKPAASGGGAKPAAEKPKKPKAEPKPKPTGGAAAGGSKYSEEEREGALAAGEYGPVNPKSGWPDDYDQYQLYKTGKPGTHDWGPGGAQSQDGASIGKPLPTKPTGGGDSGRLESGKRRFDRPPEGDVDTTEVNDYAEKNFGAWRESLSLKEFDAVAEYQGIAFRDINTHYRKGKPPLDSDYKKIAAHLDVALKKATVPEDMVAFRGMGTRGAELMKAGVGAKIKDAAFMSTSLSQKTATEFSWDNKQGERAIAQIKVPKGANGALVNVVQDIGEAELLLPRGSEFVVTGITQDPSGVNIVEMELLMPGTKSLRFPSFSRVVELYYKADDEPVETPEKKPVKKPAKGGPSDKFTWVEDDGMEIVPPDAPAEGAASEQPAMSSELAKASKQWALALSEEAVEGIAYYKGDGFAVINSLLRDQPISETFLLVGEADAMAKLAHIEKAEAAVRAIDSALTFALPSNAVVYRGLAFDPAKIKPGSVVQDQGYVSASLSSEIAQGQAEPAKSPLANPFLPAEPEPAEKPAPQSVVARIHVPAGTKVGVFDYVDADDDPEYEIVLPRNSIFTIHRVSTVDGLTYLDMSYGAADG